MPDYAAMARAAALKYGVDPNIFVAQMALESGNFSEDVVTGQRDSPAGARGIAQLMPVHWSAVDPTDPAAALDYAARLMAHHLKVYNGDYSLALAAYNAGPGNVEKYGGVPPFEETQNYVSRLLGTSGGGGTMATGTQASTYEAILAKMAELAQQQPEFGSDEYFIWLRAMNDLSVAAGNVKPSSSSSGGYEDPLQTDFQNKIQEFTAKIGYDQATAEQAMAEMERFLGLREDSRARAEAIAAGKDTIQKYGTQPGKSTFSANDLGAAFGTWADILGIDRGSQDFAKYSGTIRIDPEADLRRFDAANGVSGLPPTLPGMITRPEDIPTRPGAGLTSGIIGGNGGSYGAPAVNPFYAGGDLGQGAAIDPDLAPAQTYFPPSSPVTLDNVMSQLPGMQSFVGNSGGGGALAKATGKVSTLMPIKNPYYKGGK